MKHIRIKLVGNESRLEYFNAKQGIHEFSSVIGSTYYNWNGNPKRISLTRALHGLMAEIKNRRNALREVDKLAERGNDHFLNLLRNKRVREARKAFDSKKPLNKTKHIGVEIEFLSASSREDIARTLAKEGLTSFVELKRDISVGGEVEGVDTECTGQCREDCDCSFCGETHFCDSDDECASRCRSYEGRNAVFWEYKYDCDICDETETLEDCDCDGEDKEGNKLCKGDHIVCSGHCKGHSCQGYDDHDDYDCNCECNCTSDCGHEIAIVATHKKIADVVTRVCKVLEEHNSKVNQTCGLHVHLDMRGFDESKAFSNLYKSQKLFFAMVPHSRFNNNYCKPNIGPSMAKHHGRYWGINPEAYKEHETIEVRLHSGTINSVKINHWIKLLQKVAYSKSKMREINKLSDLTKSIVIPKDLVKYIGERLNKFKSGKRGYAFLDDVNVKNVVDTMEIVADTDSEAETLIAA